MIDTTLNELYDYAESQGLSVDCIQSKSVESMSISIEDECYIGINPMLLRSERDEMVKLAHEIGHCVMGAFYTEGTPYYMRNRCENIAENWAIKKLIPKDKFELNIMKGYEPWQIAEEFDLPEAMIRKAAELYYA